MPDPEAVDVHTDHFRQEGHGLFHLPMGEQVGRSDPGHWRHQARESTQRSAHSRYQHQDSDAGRNAVGRCNASPLPAQSRPGHAGNHRGQAADAGHDGAPPGHRARRHDLVRELRRRPPRATESENGRDQGMGFAVGAALRPFRHRRARRRRLRTTNPACAPTCWCASTSRRENFQSWPIKSGNVYAGILRNARTTRQGTLLIHQTATNRVIEVTPQRTRAAAAQ